MREVITTLLEEEGYRVTSAATGEEGIEKVKEDACDLVLLDLMLPSMSGLEALEEITLIDPDSVVVMISAYPSIETPNRVLSISLPNRLRMKNCCWWSRTV